LGWALLLGDCSGMDDIDKQDAQILKSRPNEKNEVLNHSFSLYLLKNPSIILTFLFIANP